MYEKIMNLCLMRGISIRELERRLGFGNNTIGGWRSASPRVENLQKVADFFDVSIVYFLEDAKALPVKALKEHMAEDDLPMAAPIPGQMSIPMEAAPGGESEKETCTLYYYEEDPAPEDPEEDENPPFIDPVPFQYAVDDGQEFDNQVRIEDVLEQEAPAEEPVYVKDEDCSDCPEIEDMQDAEGADGFDDLCYEEFEEPA